MAAAANRAATSIEFIVKPKEDLFLEGALRILPRVNKNDPYPCKDEVSLFVDTNEGYV